MRLDRLLGDLEVVEVHGDPATTEIGSITHDSRAVSAGALFCCIPGARVDGHHFAAESVAAGATALLCERLLPLDVTQVVVRSTKPAMALAAASFFGHPSRRLAVVGVTGTNGKTTTTHLLQGALEAAGTATGIIGTLTAARTTPEATELQATLARMVEEGKQAVAMEVSSHALAQHRVDGTHFAVGVFTNLTPEHLDFHGTMEDYFEAKATLFAPGRTEVAVINVDDPYGRLLASRAGGAVRPFSIDDAEHLDLTPTSATFRWRGHPVHLSLGGRFNVANAVAAATAAEELGADPGSVAAGLSSVVSVPGRLEPVDAGQPFTVVVDYAHTPAALEQVLTAARQAATGKVVVVFGAGGDRDRAKRPAMGQVAARLADLVVLTSDNPRQEDPGGIIQDVASGVDRREVLEVEPDRRVAIVKALTAARPGDVVVIAGKGHETVQVVGNDRVPFDDRDVARQELARLVRC